MCAPPLGCGPLAAACRVRHRGRHQEPSLPSKTKPRKGDARARPRPRLRNVAQWFPLRTLVGGLLVAALGLGAGVVIGLSMETGLDGAATAPADSATASAPAAIPKDEAGRGESRMAAPRPPATAAPEEPDRAASPPWLRHAVAVAHDDRPAVAIVIDDAGLNRAQTARLNALPAPLTVSFLSYADDLQRQTELARAAGHEIFLHVPMAPLSDRHDPGPRALHPESPAPEIRESLAWALARTSGYVGINNHMGSRFTGDEGAMEVLLGELKGRGLAFLDSRTTAASVGESVAMRHGLPFAARDVFLDHDLDAGAIAKQLDRLEKIARGRGSAIAIGHPRRGTLDVLGGWLATLDERGLALVPVSAIIKRRAGG